jgi:hypothetical protein
VLLENEAARFALVSVNGEVSRYKVGDVLGDGTKLLEIGEQSLRVSEGGSERDIFLYHQQPQTSDQKL